MLNKTRISLKDKNPYLYHFFLVQESVKAKPATIGLSIRKDIFMSPKKEVIELGVSKVDHLTGKSFYGPMVKRTIIMTI